LIKFGKPSTFTFILKYLDSKKRQTPLNPKKEISSLLDSILKKIGNGTILENLQIGNKLFLKGSKCNLHYWHILNDPLKIAPRQDLMGYRPLSQTKEIIRMAHELYPGGIEIPYHLSSLDAFQKTQQSLALNTIIYNACFSYSHFVSRSDILVPREDSFVDIIDISSNTNPKYENFLDLAFQKFVVEQTGYKIKDIIILYINSNINQTLPIFPDSFFKRINALEKIVSLEKEVSEKCNYLINISHSKPSLNEMSCKSPKDCRISPHCWNLREEMNIFSLRESREISKRLFENKIFYLRDIPDDVELNKIQKIQVECDKNRSIYKDKTEISEFLNRIEFPYYFLDFEAINPAIPIYPNSRAFQHIPFLYSLHIQKEDGSLENVHFIEEEGEDPRIGILKNLSNKIGSTGSIICYNDTIEKKCIKESTSVFPEYTPWWNGIKDNFVDLSLPFKNFSYYNPLQNGSTSLKAVITPLTGLDYSHLNIHDGSIANKEYLNLKLDTKLTTENRNILKKDLIAYCQMDTFAMLEIIKKLKEIVRV
jgi:hypothetical protein